MPNSKMRIQLINLLFAVFQTVDLAACNAGAVVVLTVIMAPPSTNQT